MNWETVLFLAFSAIGIVQYVKGIWKDAPNWVWAILQPALCIAFSATWAYLPTWVSQGIVALALSQIGYETIIQTVKAKLLPKE